MRVLSFLLSRTRRSFLISIVAGLGVGVCTGLLVARLRNVVHGKTSIVELAVLCVLLFAVHRTSRAALYHCLHKGVLPAVRREIVGKILGASLRSLEKISNGRLIAALTEQTMQVSFAADAWLIAARSIAAVIACSVFALTLSPQLFAVSAVGMIVGLVLFGILNTGARRLAHAARLAQEAAVTDLRGLVLSAPLLKLAREKREAFVAESLEPHVREAHARMAGSGGASAIAGAWANVALLASLGAVLFGPARAWASAPVLAGYAIAFTFMQSEIGFLFGTAPILRQGEEAMRAINGLALLEEETETDAAITTWKSIELRGVTHSYKREDQPADFTLGPIDLKLTPGEIVFVVGGNGGGKSTLAKILVGLYQPEKGEILLDGLAADRDRYRTLFSAVLADFHVFPRLFGLGKSIDQRANDQLTRLLLDPSIVNVEGGVFSSTDLSTGQRKRLALATAALEGRPICLFDECASDQDPEFKDFFYRTYLPELRSKGVTVIAITHDERWFSHADRVLRVEDGKLSCDAAPSTYAG